MNSTKITAVTDQLVKVQTAKQQAKVAEKQHMPAPGSVHAVPIETARAEVNAAALMTAAMAPAAGNIFSIGSVAVKLGNVLKAVGKINAGGTWGFWALAIIIGIASIGSTVFAHEGQNLCPQEYDQLIEASEIKGGRHITFSTRDLVVLDAPNVHMESIILNIAVRGKKSHLKKLAIALNGVQGRGKYGLEIDQLVERFLERLNKDKKLKSWWHKRYWRYYAKHAFYWHRDSLVVSIDLSDILINAGEHFSPWFQKLIRSRGALTLSVRSKLFILDAELRVMGTVAMPCDQPAPVPTASPTPTPAPVAPTTKIDSFTPDFTPTSQTGKTIYFSSDQQGATFYCSLNGGVEAPCSSPHVISGLESGNHKFKVRARNSYGLEDAVGAEHAWAVDTIAPDVVIGAVTPADSVTNSSTIAVEFSSNENSQFQCSLNGGAYAACTSPVSYSGLGEGTHSIAVIGVDDAGNTSLAPAVYSWRIDQTPPVASIERADPAASVTSSTDAIFNFSANESSNFECSVDGGVFQSCMSPYSISGLQDGVHSVAVRAVDLAGNASQTATYAWTVDTAAPQVVLSSVVPEQGITNARAISVEFSAGETASFTCSFDGAAAVECESPFAVEIATEGNHELVIGATDLAGNVAQPVTVAWIMDFSSPQISFGAMEPSSASVINSSSLTVNVNSTEPVSYTSYLDGVNINQTETPIQLSGLSEGAHQLVLDAVDGAGNPANTIAHSFTVDLTAPQITMTNVAVTGVTNQTSNTIEFAANEVATFECNFNGSGFSACVSPQSFAGLVEGGHVFQVRAIDIAGNVSPTASVNWTVDQTAPVTSITNVTPSGSVIGAGSISVSFSASESNATSQCSFDGGTFIACISPFTASGLGDGSHSIQIRSIDAAGNVEQQPATYSFAVDATAPTVALSASVPVLTNNVNVSFTFSANEPATFECTLDGVTNLNCASPVTYNDLADGQHRFHVTAKDSFGNVSLASSFSWTIDTTAPMTFITAQQGENNAPNIIFTMGASEEGSTFQCSLDGAPFMICSSTTSYSDLAAGEHVFMARAIDGAGNIDAVGASHSFTVVQPLTTTITSVNPSSSITSLTSITFEFAANDAAATFECSLDGAAHSPCASPMSYSGLAAGGHTFNVRAVVGTTVESVGASHSWTIDTTMPIPTSVTVSVTSTTATIAWTTNKPTTTMLYWGEGTDTSRIYPEDSVYKTSHSVTLENLKPNFSYSYRMAGHDEVGNFMFYSRRTFKTNP